jgi:hypothetical protein
MAKQNQKGANLLGLELSPFETFDNPLTLTTRISERQYGQFYRLIPLPEEANVEQAKAKFENGVLQVSVPDAWPQSTRRQIPAESGSRPATSPTPASGESPERRRESSRAA